MKENKEIAIDVVQLFKILWKKKIAIILTAIVAAVLAFGVSSFVLTPEYSSTTRIYVVNRNQSENAGLTNQDLQAGSYLVKDYKEIILSQDVLEKVISNLKLEQTGKGLSKKIQVTVPVDTRIVSIAVKDDQPEEASRIANALREVAAEKIIKVTRVSDVTTLEEARPALTPSSPNIRRNTMLAFLAGGAVMVILIILLELLDDRVKRPEDVEEVMQVALLGIVPDLNKLK
ncbi:CspC family polysaccharide chain length determinant protein [Streptococcus mitis]|uniref:CspC family polysaccharide chain length determinant protein n=1 Tax=Streptococcus mitis TaxID=28037 RepID=UPI001CBBC631|nr:Wzz/FepE/Etk N-terminal domain-containing protein [Streptococcus mitis]MBZ2107295.1 capsular biosynthesis protein CpsC [Streptococcus mitis]MBZ2113653.1 capsular biosynthesis protein CpsC [Streptococcus mitis]